MLFFLFKVFPPAFRELPPPALELFDLDETFSSEKARLAEITNKCKQSRLLTRLYKKSTFLEENCYILFEIMDLNWENLLLLS